MRQDVEDFLEHFGRKGMKWGVRNEKQPLTSEERRERRIKTAKLVGVGVGVGVATFTAVQLSKRMDLDKEKYKKGAVFVANKAKVGANAPVKAAKKVGKGANMVRFVLASMI